MSIKVAGIELVLPDHQAVILNHLTTEDSPPEVGIFWLHMLTPNINANH